jgi:uncharacterized membrane protein
MEITRPSEDRSLKDLVSDLGQNTGLLVRQEIALAKAEIRNKVAGIAKTAVTFGVAGLLAYAGVLALLATVVLGIVALGVAAWLATLIVSVVILAAAYVLVQRGRRP